MISARQGATMSKESTESTPATPNKGEVLFFYPEQGVSVYAVNRESADKKLKDLTKEKDTSNG
jgi:hypothetical protein